MNNNSISDEATPTQFFLGQNYPNPFRKKTVIKYCVPLKTKVRISVFNTEGVELKTLVDEVKNPGTYEVNIQTSNKTRGEELNLSDGYYYYEMLTEEYLSEKKWLCKNSWVGRFDMKLLLQVFSSILLLAQICLKIMGGPLR